MSHLLLLSAKTGALALALLLSGAALAFDYRVESTGGPLTLADDVAAAVAAWAQESDFEAAAAEGAPNVFTYGPTERFGPDLHSLTVARGSGEAREVRVLLRPNLGDLTQPVLLHEVGLLAGLPETDSGVMNPRLVPDRPAAPTTDEVEALQTLGAFPPEDINRDGVVDFYDLIALARAFGQTGVNLPADINQDGVVDRADLARLEAAYTFGPPAETPPAALEAELEQAPLGEDGLPPVPGPAGFDEFDEEGLGEDGFGGDGFGGDAFEDDSLWDPEDGGDD